MPILDADGFDMPARARSQTPDSSVGGPPSVGSRADSGRTATTFATSLVDKDDYRIMNLGFGSGIKMRDFDLPLPAAVQALVEPLGLDEAPPDPTEVDRWQLRSIRLHDDESARPLKTIIRPTFDHILFPLLGNKDPQLVRADGLAMNEATLPKSDYPEEPLPFQRRPQAPPKLSVPMPDILYGYHINAFPAEIQLAVVRVLQEFRLANAAQTILPFFLVEFNGDGGSMWACQNQCMGGSAVCVNIGTHLSALLTSQKHSPFNSTIFSLIINGNHASLCVAWKPEPEPEIEEDCLAEFWVQKIGWFALGDMRGFLVLQRAIRRIMEWGRGKRLEEISKHIALLETRRGREETRRKEP